MLRAAITGFLGGFIVSIPTGPVNLTILNEAARRGFKWAALISIGATLMEVVYCFIAFTSLGSLFQTNDYMKAGMELVSFVFLLYLGIRFLRADTVRTAVQFGKAADRIGEKIEERLHPHSAFMTGFVRVLANPGVLVFWVVFAAFYISRGIVIADWPGKLTCVGGVALGTAMFYLTLSFCGSRGYGRWSDRTLLRMEHFSGVCLLALAAIHGFRIIWEMVQHHARR